MTQMAVDSPFHSVVGLGAFKAEYANRGRGRWFNLVFGLLCCAAAPALLLLAVFLGFNAYNQFGLRRVDEAVIVPLIFAAVAFAVGALVLFNLWRNWSLAAALYEQGVALYNRSGLQQVCWPDVEAVWQNVTRHYTNGVYTGTSHVYTLKTRDGRRLILDDRLGKGVEELGREVQRGTSEALFPQYWQALRSGQRLNFGPLGLDHEKLYAGKKELRWDEIVAIKIEKGFISVKKDKGWLNWASASVPQIPNFFIFYDLISRFAKIE